MAITKPALGSIGWNVALDAAIDAVNALPTTIAATVAATVLGAPSQQYAYTRGVNAAGGEFAADAAHLPGVYGTDYAYDATAAFTSLAARGHKLIRLPFRWERIQPTRSAALNAAELARIQGVVSDIAAAGMTCILDVHNYARYIPSGGVEQVLGDGDLTQAQLVDLWTRLSTAFKDNEGVYAYGLMNEPHDLTGSSGAFSGTTRYDWNGGTVAGWTGDAATASNASNKLRLTSTVGAGDVNFRKDDAAAVAGGSTPTGSVIRFEATLVTNPGASGGWAAKAQWQNSSFAWQNPTSVTYKRVDNGATVTGLVQSVAVYVTSTFSSISSPPQAFCIQIDGSGATAGSVVVDIDNFAQGATSGGSTGAQVWETASQACVAAIRANDDDTKILVSGYGFSGAQTWPTNHPTPWIVGGGDIAYEAHYYFDSDNSGDYPDTYATENSAAVSGGYASLTARAVTELSLFTDWVHDNSVSGHIGEIGWPNTADTASWNATGAALYDVLDASRIGATYWAAGARWGTGYNLSAYTGTNQDTVKSQASVIEAHPALALTVDALQDEIDSLDTRYPINILTLDQTGASTSKLLAPKTVTGSGSTAQVTAWELVDAPVGSGGTGAQGSPGLVWQGTWSGATTYATNDAVSYSGSAFIASAGVTGTTPGTSASPNSPWQVLAATYPSGVVALSDAATIATDASLGNLFRVTLGGNRTLGNPTNPTNGQSATWELAQDATGSRTLALDTAFALGTTIASTTLTTTASKRDFLTAVYNSTTAKWYVTAFTKGF